MHTREQFTIIIPAQAIFTFANLFSFIPADAKIFAHVSYQSHENILVKREQGPIVWSNIVSVNLSCYVMIPQ